MTQFVRWFAVCWVPLFAMIIVGSVWGYYNPVQEIQNESTLAANNPALTPFLPSWTPALYQAKMVDQIAVALDVLTLLGVCIAVPQVIANVYTRGVRRLGRWKRMILSSLYRSG